jgi:DUF4097 and DUF4098 domain-containing protein YvlB
MRRKLYFYHFVLLALLSSSAAVADTQERQEIRRSFTLNPGATITLGNISGDIRISSTTGSHVEMVAIKSGPASQINQVEVSTKAQPSRLVIETVYPKHSNNKVSVRYDLKVPRNVVLDGIHSVSGNIEIADIAGRVVGQSVSGKVYATRTGQEVKLDSVSGSVRVLDAAGRVSIHSVSGSAIAENIKGDLEAKSISGSVQIRQVQGYIRAENVSGNIFISGGSPSGATASTVSGAVQFDVRLNPSGRYDLKSHSGSITLHLPADSNFALRASTFSGSINSDFNIKANGFAEKKTISGVAGTGGSSIELSSFSGSVQILK